MDVVLPKTGKYVVAVSGGVDSMVLLDMLAKTPGLELVVAHFNHGIRDDSVQDRQLVERVASTLSAYCVCGVDSLGPDASEAKAREARYKFLRQVVKETGAQAIITAHHQDDVIETAILNMLRGTGRKGLTSLASSQDIIRPLLGATKADLRRYAQAHALKWREDTTNLGDDYLRNYVRHNVIPKLNKNTRQQLLHIIKDLRKTNTELDTLLVKHLLNQSVKGQIDRDGFNGLPHGVARELMAAWLRSNEIRGFDKKALERLVVAAKTGAVGKSFPVLSGYSMRVNKGYLALVGPER